MGWGSSPSAAHDFTPCDCAQPANEPCRVNQRKVHTASLSVEDSISTRALMDL